MESKFNIGDRVKLVGKYDIGKVIEVRYDPSVDDFQYKVDFPIGQLWFSENSLEKVSNEKKTEETGNVVFTSVKNVVEPGICNYTTVDKFDETLADVEKQIKNVDKKHNKKTKDVEKLYDSLNADLLQLDSKVAKNKSELQDKTDKLANEFRDYMQYQEDVKHFKEFCKQCLKCDFVEDSYFSHREIAVKFYKYVVKERIKELKREHKTLSHFNFYDKGKSLTKIIDELYGGSFGKYFNQFERIIAYNSKKR